MNGLNLLFNFQIGLVEKEWLDTLPTINPEQITFIDYVEAGEKLASQLKKEVNIFERGTLLPRKEI